MQVDHHINLVGARPVQSVSEMFCQEETKDDQLEASKKIDVEQNGTD